MANINSGYFTTNRGIIKIFQIICGFIICSLLCTSWYGGKSCFGEGRIGYASGLNFVMVVINIVFFLLNFLNLAVWKLERVYSVIGAILFFVATILLVWYIFEHEVSRGTLIASTVFIFAEFLLFLWDVKILQGEATN